MLSDNLKASGSAAVNERTMVLATAEGWAARSARMECSRSGWPGTSLASAIRAVRTAVWKSRRVEEEEESQVWRMSGRRMFSFRNALRKG